MVPHNWLIKALQLAKVPQEIIKAIQELGQLKPFYKQRMLPLRLTAIDYRRGILQGDGLSVILFVLSINPASFIIKTLKDSSLEK